MADNVLRLVTYRILSSKLDISNSIVARISEAAASFRRSLANEVIVPVAAVLVPVK